MKTLITILICVLLCGCAAMRKTATDISSEEVKNLEATRQVAKDYLTIWPMQSGLIKGALGPRMDEMPTQAIAAINELDTLSEKLNEADPNSIKDYELGLSLGLRIRLLGSVVQEALKLYAPDVLDLIPVIF